MIFPKVYERILMEAQKNNVVYYAYIDGYCWYLIDNNGVLFKDEDNVLNCSSICLRHVQPDKLEEIKKIINYKSPLRLHKYKCEKLEDEEKRIKFIEGYSISNTRYRLFKTQKTPVIFFGEDKKVYIVNPVTSKLIAVISAKVETNV